VRTIHCVCQLSATTNFDLSAWLIRFGGSKLLHWPLIHVDADFVGNGTGCGHLLKDSLGRYCLQEGRLLALHHTGWVTFKC